MKNNWGKLLISIFIAEAAGIVGSVATIPKISGWYLHLNKPFFNPPNWIFGPVWTGLYLMMGVSMYLILLKRRGLGNGVFRWYWIQLLLNILWSWVFFGNENLGMGMVIILMLWWSIRMTIKSFAKVEKNSAILLIPYLAWVSFATILNAAAWGLNR